MRHLRWLGLAVVLGCAHRGGEDEAMLALYARLDAGWPPPGVVVDASLDRGDIDRLQTELSDLKQARAVRPDDPELAWRHARVLVALGVLEEDLESARRFHAEARSVASACSTAGATTVEPSEAVLLASRAPCVAWTADAWTRWAGTWDPAAVAVDQATITKWLRSLPTEGEYMVPALARASWARLRGVSVGVPTD